MEFLKVEDWAEVLVAVRRLDVEELTREVDWGGFRVNPDRPGRWLAQLKDGRVAIYHVAHQDDNLKVVDEDGYPGPYCGNCAAPQ